MFSELPRFNAARRYGIILAVFGIVFVAAAAILLSITVKGTSFAWLGYAPLPKAFGYLAAAFLLPASGFLSAAMMSFARQGYLRRENSTETAKPRRSGPVRPAQRIQASVSLLLQRYSLRAPDTTLLADWPQSLVALLVAIAALWAVAALWPMPAERPTDPFVLKMFAGGLVIAAFPLLVLERIYANLSPDLLPEAPFLDRLLRVPLATVIAAAVGMVLVSAGLTWAVAVDTAVAVVIAAVAVELMLRAAATLFVPFAAIAERRSVADSSIAGSLLRLSIPSIRTFNLTVRRQLGIDLSRSWALSFVQKAALPVLAGIALFAWIVTGVTSLSVNERGVYERLGKPVAVFQPGLHVHFPWPLGIVRPVEVGVIHQLPIEFLLPNGSGQIVDEPPEPTVSAEAPAPESADRLWDDAHPFEGSYLIASEENGQQSFQLSDVDMAVVYQVAPSDTSARDAAYRVTDADELIQALSGQILIKYLSHNTLLDLLGKSRESFSTDFQAALQKQLDQFSAGLEVLAISIEAIHPPPAAATAYHNVQAAEIRSLTQISASRGDAARTKELTTMQATEAENQATGDGAELVSRAQTTAVLFGADREGYLNHGASFLLERWFSNLGRAMKRAQTVIIDHRLRGEEVPMLDLRPASTAAADSTGLPTAAGSGRAPPEPPAGDND